MQAYIQHLEQQVNEQNHYLEQQQAQLHQLQSNRAESAGADIPDPQILIEEIDRLNGVIARLDEEIAQFKLQLAGMVNQEGRIEEHLVTMVLMMAEIDALRDRIRSTESEIKSVRKSFIQATLENDSNRSGPQLLDLASHEHAHSRDELDVYSARKSPRHVQPTLDVRPPTEEEGEPQLHMPSEPSE